MASTSIMLDPTPSAPREAREALAPLSAILGAKRFFDLRIVVTELITNSVRHGPLYPIQLQVEAGQGEIKGEVRDEGSRTGSLEAALSDPQRRGFGLRIVDALVDEWGVLAGSTRVWFRIRWEQLP